MSDPLVFIHGFGGSSGLWRWQAEYFSARGNVVAVDLPGHGQRLWKGESLEEMAVQVRAQCREAGIASVDMVASSFGGLVAVRVCDLFPGFVRRLVLTGALPRFMAADDFPAGLDTAKIRKLAGQCAGDIGTVLDIFFRSLFTRKEKERPRYFQIRELRAGSLLPSREGLLGVLALLEKEDLRPEFARLSPACLLIAGDSDPLCPLAVVESLRSLLPTLELEVLKDVAHFPFLSIPDVFNRRVERFLQ